ncbi:MAG: metal ABC transporter permease [Deltaproteobacteria bacterium]|nr:metal ABC transporter permease [Deltaproteobacteria bacterium]
MIQEIQNLFGPVYGWILAMGIAVSLSCAVLGSFLVVRKMSLIGDAISHAVLPGLAIAFLFSGSRATIPMLLGAIAMGMTTSFLIEFVSQKSFIKKDAATGIVFTSLFAIGVILISLFADKIDLDQECVLYGEITFIPLEPHFYLGNLDLGPYPFVIMSGVCLVVVLVVILFYKELVLTSFDPALALSLGVPVTFIHYLLMGLVSTTIVSAFESVGAILVVAMLIAPAATAYLLTNRFSKMLLLASLFAVLNTFFGLYFAIRLDASVAGGIAVAGFAFFLLAFLFSPSQGLVSRAIKRA